MNKRIFITILFLIILSLGLSAATNQVSLFDKIKISNLDIPSGFMYGKIPDFAQNVLKENPWGLDRPAINRLAKNIYPGGNSVYIKEIHMTILTRTSQPYGDDIVCYMILYRDKSTAKTEISKIQEYVKYNSDRAILKFKDNIAVFIHADDVQDYDLIFQLSKKIEERLNSNPELLKKAI